MFLFFIGIKDDLYRMVPWKKLAGQLCVAFILVHFGQIRILTFYGLFGINDLNQISSYLLSVFTIVVITNSFNLIDGVDCLAGSVGILSSLIFGSWFYFLGSSQYALLAFSLTGSLSAFIWYNKTPARIFMGDTGSLIVGGISSVLAIQFIEMNRVMDKNTEFKVLSVPVVTIGVLIIPLFDTVRVFILRLLKNQSPFSGDRKHIHHELLNRGFTHVQTTLILLGFNLFVVGMVYCLQGIKGEVLLSLILILCFCSSQCRFLLHILSQKVGNQTFVLFVVFSEILACVFFGGIFFFCCNAEECGGKKMH
jgi:UDP-N-acetylmuramyl pentapeptide phosphotransferase/UDP-N-acetylglucosamine-1-phosphate transferase